MILGTAQLGMNYGIHNTTGKPAKEDTFCMLDYAWEHGVHILDTAGAYGNAEELIGEYQVMTQHRFRVCTKSVSETVDGLAADLENSLRQLKCEQIWLYYLHRYESCRNDTILRMLEMAKKHGKISNVGISVYEPKELLYILETLSGLVNIVQIPFNLLDNARWQNGDLLKRAKEKGIRIFARSIFLQGLFFQDPDSETAKRLSASNILRELQQLAVEYSMNMQQLAVMYVLSYPAIDDMILGSETLGQLKQNISLTNGYSRKSFSADILQQIEALSKSADEDIIDPRKWSRRD